MLGLELLGVGEGPMDVPVGHNNGGIKLDGAVHAENLGQDRVDIGNNDPLKGIRLIQGCQQVMVSGGRIYILKVCSADNTV